MLIPGEVGSGDDYGVADGIIVDPSGLGAIPAATGSISAGEAIYEAAEGHGGLWLAHGAQSKNTSSIPGSYPAN